MSKKKSSHPHLVRIVQHMIRLERYINDTNLDKFLSRNKDYDAILKQIDLLGEQIMRKRSGIHLS